MYVCVYAYVHQRCVVIQGRVQGGGFDLVAPPGWGYGEKKYYWDKYEEKTDIWQYITFTLFELKLFLYIAASFKIGTFQFVFIICWDKMCLNEITSSYKFL